VQEFQLRFEELKSLMLSKNPFMTEEYFVSNFVGGLNYEIRLVVKMFKPQNVQAFEGASLQELTVEALMKKQRSQNKGSNSGLVLSRGRMQSKENFRGGTGVRYLTTTPPNSTLQQMDKLIKHRRVVGLCFRCGDRYFPRHHCKKQLLVLEGEEEER